jgi:7,8-dihydro-6-hydroxymethylpterin dimethyltransferase
MRSVVFQPVAHSGRHVEFDQLQRLTNSDVIELLAGQCPDWFRTSDPRCHDTRLTPVISPAWIV